MMQPLFMFLGFFTYYWYLSIIYLFSLTLSFYFCPSFSTSQGWSGRISHKRMSYSNNGWLLLSFMYFINYFFGLLLIFFNIYTCEALSPLVVWSNNQPISLVESCGTEAVTPSTFQTFSTVFNENYLKCIQKSNPNKFVLFIEQDFKVEDLRKFYSSNLDEKSEKIKETLKSSNSLTIPAFENENFSESFIKMVSTEIPHAEIEVVHLNNDLKTSIEKISNIFESSLKDTFFVWTSSTTSNEKENNLSRKRRDSPETDVGASFFYNDTCLFLSFSSLNMTFEKSYGLIHLEPISETFKLACTGNTSKLVSNFNFKFFINLQTT